MRRLSNNVRSSGQNSCPGRAKKLAIYSATAAGVPGEFGYRACPTMRRTPFSVSGQVAQAFFRIWQTMRARDELIDIGDLPPYLPATHFQPTEMVRDMRGMRGKFPGWMMSASVGVET